MAATSNRAAYDDIQRIEAAPFLIRLTALAIDGMIVLIPTMAVTGFPDDLPISEGALVFALSILTLPIKLLPAVGILAILEGLSGRMVGKLLTGLRIVDVENGEPIGLLRAIGRRGFMVLESYALFIPSLILVPFNGNFDGHLGDRLTGAIVARNVDIEQAFGSDAPSASSSRPGSASQGHTEQLH